MSIFPDFSNVNGFVVSEFNRRMDNTEYVSSLNAWIRVSSGVGAGLIMQSNANFSLLKAAGVKTGAIYGNASESGALGTDWSGNQVSTGVDVGLRPSPIVSSFECDEGGGTATLSRKATFKITTFTQKQCDAVCKYFLEPGFTVFIEWGWNQPEAFTGYSDKLSANYVVNFNSIKNLQSRRQKCKGLYDNYLGFITGGSIAANGDKWEITVNCTGFPELPAYLMISDKVTPKKSDVNKGPAAVSFVTSTIQNETDLGKKRFMMMFNQLPSNRRSAGLQAKLFKNSMMLLAINYINFDEAVRENFQSIAGDSVLAKAEGILSLGLVDGTTTIGVKDSYEIKDANGQTIATEKVDSVEIPDGTKLIGEEKFIRFGAVMEIINSLGAVGYVIGNKKIKFRIESRECVCSAFKKIFSTDKTKLFIPNQNTPKFSIAEALNSPKPQTDFTQVQDNSVKFGGDNNKVIEITFPYKGTLTNGKVTGGSKGGAKIGLVDAAMGTAGVTKATNDWGFLDDLYVNFDFVKGIIETKNFLMKDALYQILNGISSAAGSVWDFQIIEQSNADGTDVILKIVDLNFVSKQDNPLAGIMALPMTGPNSVFIDASLDLDISGAKMNQIIGSRLGTKNNSSSPSTTGALFAVGLTDMVLNKIEMEKEETLNLAESAGTLDESSVKKEESGNVKKPDGTIEQSGGNKFLGKAAKLYNSAAGVFTDNPDYKLTIGLEQAKIDDTNTEIEQEKERNFKLFLDKVGVYPRVQYQKDSTLDSKADGFNLYDTVYIGALNDLTVFEHLKLGYEIISDVADNNTGPIMPIEFTFTVHGISGMKRGDKFRILGLPAKYSTAGFFQVMTIKHTIDGMLWKTEIKGGFRQVSLKTAQANAKTVAANAAAKKEGANANNGKPQTPKK
jgi:hypothetical protein